MSYQVGSACYSTAEAAASASASNSVGSVVTHGGASYVVGVDGVTAASITYTLQPIGGGVPLQLISAYQPQPCGLLTAADAASLGSVLLGLWVSVYAVMFLRRALWGGGSDGNA